jgi:hypothetical protein
MPMAMRLLLGAIAAQLLIDVVALALPGHAADVGSGVAALGIDLAILALLAHGSELARSLVRIGAGVGMALDAWLLLTTWVWAPRDLVGFGAIFTAGLMFAMSTLAFVVLGREDVKRWVFDRWLARHE